MRTRKSNMSDFVTEEPPKRTQKKYMRYSEATEYYGIGLTKFKEVARNAGAIRKIGRLVCIDTEKLEAFIDTFEP